MYFKFILCGYDRLEHTPTLLDESRPNKCPNNVRRTVRHRMLIVFVRTHYAQRKVQVQIVGNRVIGHFPGESNAGADVAEQRQAVFQARIFVEGNEDLD